MKLNELLYEDTAYNEFLLEQACELYEGIFSRKAKTKAGDYATDVLVNTWKDLKAGNDHNRRSLFIKTVNDFLQRRIEKKLNRHPEKFPERYILTNRTPDNEFARMLKKFLKDAEYEDLMSQLKFVFSFHRDDKEDDFEDHRQAA